MPSGSTIVIGDKEEGPYLTNGPVVTEAATDVTKLHSTQKWYFNAEPDEDVITLCERYLSNMSARVYDCREKFGAAAPN
jgi:hypothetical protein